MSDQELNTISNFRLKPNNTVRNILIGIFVLVVICGCMLLCCSSSFSMLSSGTTPTEEEVPDAILDVNEYDYGNDNVDYGDNSDDTAEPISLDINKPLDESKPPEQKPNKPNKPKDEEASSNKPKSIKASDAKLVNKDGKSYLILSGKSPIEIKKNSIKKKGDNIYFTLTSGKNIVIIGKQ